MQSLRRDFGYHPGPLQVRTPRVAVTPLEDLAQTVKESDASEGVEDGWIYAPPQQVRNLGGAITTRPYSSRVFGLPRTHMIELNAPDNEDHLAFHLWTLSLFTGLRLTATEAGFLDATPLRPGALVDFIPLGSSLQTGVDMAEAFWDRNRVEPKRAQQMGAAVHALFVGQNPQHLQFERFLYFYTALDACFALAASIYPPAKRPMHKERIAWMCGLFNMPVPVWADPADPANPLAARPTELSIIRNDAIHEALFMGAPLGFALHGVDERVNLTLEMEALICRLLIALLGGDKADYVRSPVNTRQRHGLRLA